MGVLNPFPQVSYALEKSLGLWFSIWAIRYSAGIDYRLSARARTIRWMLVVTCFAFTSVTGTNIGWFRVSSYLVGLGFLCWPNLAYHLGKFFEEWPTTEGRVESAQQQSNVRWTVAYDFEVGAERYGGHDTVKSDRLRSDTSAGAMRVFIRYDPLNPGRSSRIQRIETN